MTLERLTERLEEERLKVGKVDGRRFNSRSKTKMTWEMRNIRKSIAVNDRRKKNGNKRSMYTKEELKEYKEIEDKFREDKRAKMNKPSVPSSPPSGTPSGTPTNTPSGTPHGTPSKRSRSIDGSNTPPQTRRKYTA